jgi:peptidoglycan/xylan/chitin deacetylase (PgdA/CDA1 family)
MTIGIQAEKSDSASSVDIYYGNTPAPSCRYKIKIVHNKKQCDKFIADDAIWNELLSGKILAAHVADTIEFDIIQAIEFFLLDYGNKDAVYDEHCRVPAVNSFQYRQNILSLPVINAYVLFFEEVLKNKTAIKGAPLWPHGKLCAIGLSHDVDKPDKRCFRSFCIERLSVISEHIKHRQIGKYIYAMAGLLKFILKSPFIKQDFWLFRHIMKEEERHGMRSAFFFASRNMFSPGASRQYDVGYDVVERKFIKLFKQIKKRGFEIGLHASYNAFESADNFLMEKKRLESLAGTKVIGLRHHFWHLGINPSLTLRHHSQAGFFYDSSLAFNDMMGLRRSVALPYYPWSDQENEPVKTVQIPTFLMDGNLFYRSASVSSAFSEIIEQIGILKKYGGVGVIDWHVHTCLPMNKEYKEWGETYKRLMEYLSQDGEIWVTSPSEILRFVKARWQKAGF